MTSKNFPKLLALNTIWTSIESLSTSAAKCSASCIAKMLYVFCPPRVLSLLLLCTQSPPFLRYFLSLYRTRWTLLDRKHPKTCFASSAVCTPSPSPVVPSRLPAALVHSYPSNAFVLKMQPKTRDGFDSPLSLVNRTSGALR